VSDRLFAYACATLIWVAVIALNVWMTKAGAPQQVWFFCDTLHWCSHPVSSPGKSP
jgi:hypothetical protein